ncbi:hypothetical protein BGZ72_009186 [Mortierella alpina]|nr:hypothetical protein BGZ72_009186 [Mortierella alpina]
MHDERTRQNRRSNTPYWRSQFLESGLTRQEVEAETVSSPNLVRRQEALVKPLRKEAQELQEVQDLASGRVQKKEPGVYAYLYNARRSLRIVRLRLDGLESELKTLRQVNYRFYGRPIFSRP